MQIYDDYCPLLLNQFKSREYDEFATFDAALDEFYSKIESQKVNQQQKAKEESAAQRLNKIKLDQVTLFTLGFTMHIYSCSSRSFCFIGGVLLSESSLQHNRSSDSPSFCSVFAGESCAYIEKGSGQLCQNGRTN